MNIALLILSTSVLDILSILYKRYFDSVLLIIFDF